MSAQDSPAIRWIRLQLLDFTRIGGTDSLAAQGQIFSLGQLEEQNSRDNSMCVFPIMSVDSL